MRQDEEKTSPVKGVPEQDTQINADAQQDETDSTVVEPNKVVEDEISESVTEIEEIFQVSEDGVNWKTVKKITTITPRGTSERVVVLGGILIAHDLSLCSLLSS